MRGWFIFSVDVYRVLGGTRMEEILHVLENFSIESIVIGFITFMITMKIRKKIKSKSEVLEENKRKLVNSVLIVIPLTISICIGMVYLYYIDE